MYSLLNSVKGKTRIWKIPVLSVFFLCLFLFNAIGSGSLVVSAKADSARQTTVLWDTWGVPHIFAPNTVDLFYAFGRAQMQNHADLLLTLYGEARGRAAEYWGPDYLQSDEFVQTMGFPERAQHWLDEQTPVFRDYIQAFVAGINDYTRVHPDQISPQLKVVLPVNATDVFAHVERVMGDFMLGNCNMVLGALDTTQTSKGSNGWAISPQHSASGHALLLANPHLPWSGEYTFFEAQLSTPSMMTYGTALVGFPVLEIAFNNFLSWTHTIDTLDSCDNYGLTPSGAGYLFDGTVHAFETQTETLLVKQSDGTLKAQPLVIRRAIQGPVFVLGSGQKTETIAIRLVGVDQFPVYGILQEWWDMGLAHTLNEFQAALRRLQIPLFTVIYADRDGHVLSLFNGEVPKRPLGDWDYWQQIVPGDTSSDLWTSITPYDELPKVIDPPGGWVQNSNSPPWYTTFPQVLDPQQFPAYMAPISSMSLREQRGVDMLTAQKRLSFQQVVSDLFSSHMELADRVLDDLITAARSNGGDLAVQAADVLQTWDRTADAGSKGSALFYLWMINMQQSNAPLFAIPWSPQHPRTTPSGLADPTTAVSVLETTATTLLSLTGSLDVSWGTVFRLQRGNIDLPASGGPGDPYGIFRALDFVPGANGQYVAASGDSYMAVVEFTNPVHAQVLLTYGNASQPTSPHYGDQLTLYAHNQMREAWTTLPAIEAHLASRDVF